MSGRAPLGYSLPVDAAGWTALGLAAVLALVALSAARRSVRVPLRLWVALWAAAAAGASAFWILHYLRGGPRIIDASSYWLEARAMSHGLLAWDIEPPTASVRGRFLIASADGGRLGVIFPPGWPAVLALGFALGAPLAVGPVLGAALVAVTAWLARELSGRDEPARIAAVLSAGCACLRYHTADTMSHGLSALCLTTSLVLGLHAARTSGPRSSMAWAGCGLAAGWLLATRPASFLPLVAIGALLVLVSCHDARRVLRTASPVAAALLAGLALPALLLVVHQHAVTGRWLASSQSAYYLLADGPPGCFRYGFGKGIGCLAEHEPYVRSVLPEGHGLRSALITAGRRLHLHLSDVANTEPLWLLVPLGAWLQRRDRRVAVIALTPLAMLVAYAPFYFDGSYPGGGARFLADGIPVEHAVVAIAVASIARLSEGARALGELRALAVLAALMALGFAVRTSREHASLRERDGGRPLFEPRVVAAAGVSSGLLLVDGDHAFNLAHDPAARDASRALVVARARGDDRDRLLWERLGRPRAYRYRMDPWAAPPVPASLQPWSPPHAAAVWRFEGEAEWPPLAQSGGYAAPAWLAPGGCVSSGIALGMIRSGDEPMCVTVEVPWPGPGEWEVSVRMVTGERASVRARLQGEARWVESRGDEPAPERAPDGRRCVRMPSIRAQGTGQSGRLTVCSEEAWSALDAVEVRRSTPQ